MRTLNPKFHAEWGHQAVSTFVKSWKDLATHPVVECLVALFWRKACMVRSRQNPEARPKVRREEVARLPCSHASGFTIPCGRATALRTWLFP